MLAPEFVVIYSCLCLYSSVLTVERFGIYYMTHYSCQTSPLSNPLCLENKLGQALQRVEKISNCFFKTWNSCSTWLQVRNFLKNMGQYDAIITLHSFIKL